MYENVGLKGNLDYYRLENAQNEDQCMGNVSKKRCKRNFSTDRKH